MAMGFREMRLRAYEAGKISGNEAYMFYTVSEYVEKQKADYKEHFDKTLTPEAWEGYEKDIRNHMKPNQKFIREKLVGCQMILDFFTGHEVTEILKAYEVEISKIAEANGL